MRQKCVLFSVVLILCGLCSTQAVNSQTPAELFKLIPKAEESLDSESVLQRIAILDELVIYERDYDIVKTVLRFDLPTEDYSFVIGRIFEKDLTQIDENVAHRALSKIEFLIRKFELKEFAKHLAHYIPKFIPNDQMPYRRLSIQFGLLGTLSALQAKEFSPQIASLLTPRMHRTLYREALSTLVGFHAKEAVPALLTLLYDRNHQDRYYALTSLAKVDGKEAAPHIAKLLKDENVTNRYWALDALIKLDSHPDYAPEIREFLDASENVQSRTLAIAALIDSKDERAIPLAVELATVKDLHIRGEMLNRLVDLKAKAIVPSLIGVLNDSTVMGGDTGTDSNIRSAIINALCRLRAREAIPILRRFLRETKSRSAQRMAARTLGEFEAKEALAELLAMFFRDLPQPPDRITNETFDSAEAALAIAKIGDKSTWKALIDAAENPRFPNRSQIVQVLNRHFDPVLWKRSEETKIKGLDFESIKINAEIFSRESGIPITLEYDPAKHFFRTGTPGEYPSIRAGSDLDLQTGLKRIISTIDSGTLPNRFTYIFDDGTIRILLVENAVNWWRDKILIDSINTDARSSKH